jgi:hypothetical protein
MKNTKLLKHYATSRKVASSRPDEVNEFFNLPNPSSRTRPWGLLSLYRNEYQKQKNNVSGSRVRPVHRVDNPTAICEPIV